MKQIEFIRGGSNTILGNFEPGDSARCSDVLAQHLVADVRVAKYRTAEAKPELEGETAPSVALQKRRGRK